MLTIVAYHYVRDIDDVTQPRFNALSTTDFNEQLDYINNRYTVVDAEEVIHALRHQRSLPDNSCWLTFDDGYIDHYDSVVPALEQRGWQGSFFVPVTVVTDRKLLDVNKIHLILSKASSPRDLLNEIDSRIYASEDPEFIQSYKTLCSPLANNSDSLVRRWSDSPEVVLIKRILQRVVPHFQRNALVNYLFKIYVSDDSHSVACGLYMSEPQIKDLVTRGMYVGSHGYNHTWLSTLKKSEKILEIEKSIEFLDRVGSPIDDWVMCYPYGDWNQELVAILNQFNCAAALTNLPGVVSTVTDNPFQLKRFDTNDLPPKVLQNDF